MAREMKDSGIEWIGRIPSDWEIYRNKQLFREINERCENGSDYTLLSVSEYYGVAPKADKIAEGDFETHAESLDGYKKCSPDDIVMNIMLAWKRATGRSTYEGIISPAYCVYRPITEIDTRYFHYLFRTDLCANMFKRYSTGIIDSRLRLYPDQFMALYSPVPHKNEQVRIADFLDRKCAEIDSVIADTQHTIEEYKKLKQSIITEAVTKGVRGKRTMKDSGIEWIGDIPCEWSRDKVVRIFKKIGSGTTPKSSDDNNFNGDINWLQSGDINGGIITASKNHISQNVLDMYSALKVYESPFIIIAMYGASIGNISISQINACVNQACCVISESRLNFNYAFYALRAAKSYLVHKGIGGGQPNISQDIIKQLWLPTPDLIEQHEIVEFLDEKCMAMDRLILAKEQLLTELENYKKTVIYEYVTGKKEVPACQ